ncbi:MAG TPA: Hpt domain-containing protein [Mycobacteriales bacterium]|jgi:HPt (histidine-containing phosphotransfer) domain-containing protein|nr:Hpt domain-containing protein [Mycobacteriales bacterium]
MSEQTTRYDALRDQEPGRPPPAARFDTTTLDELVAQLGERGGALRVDLLTSYVDEGDVRIAEMVQGQADGDRAAVRRVAHTMRSSSQLLGVDELAVVLEQLEQDAAAAGNTPLDEQVATAAALYGVAAAGIALVLAEQGTGSVSA